MAFTDAQKAVLKTHMLNNTNQSVIDGLTLGGNPNDIAAWYSSITSPAFIVWRSSLLLSDIVDAMSFAGAGGYMARTAGERDAFALLVQRGSIEPWRASIRQKFGEVFSGSGAGAPETRAALLAASKRSATNVENVLATGTGSDASPATLTYEGQMTTLDAIEIVNYAA